MSWLSFVPGKATLVLLFAAAKRRVADKTDAVADLSNERIASATEELNQIADDVQEAQDAPEHAPVSIHNPDPGKILRPPKITS